MLTLNDGRAELWQWDTGRTLAVNADCSQVHFSNKVFGRSIDVDVTDGAAIIPDILLQTDKDLNVWAFVGTAENGYTKISKTFKVNRRNKPADYVFTPVEQTTIAEIAAIAQSVRDDADAGRFNGAQGPIGPQGPQGAPGTNGKDGADGYTPVKGKDYFDGKDGQDGKDGYTPVKGVDYFDGAPGKDYVLTQADKTEIAEIAADMVEVPEGGMGGADWNAAEGEPGHILNRPFYSEYGETVLLDNVNPIYVPDDEMFVLAGHLPIVAGKEYIVTWNGTVYTCTAGTVEIEEGQPFVALGNRAAMGEEDTGEPFVLVAVPENMIEAMGGVGAMIQVIDGITELTLSITGKCETVHPIPKKYLPNDLLEVPITSDEFIESIVNGNDVIREDDPSELEKHLNNGGRCRFKIDTGDSVLFADVTMFCRPAEGGFMISASFLMSGQMVSVDVVFSDGEQTPVTE